MQTINAVSLGADGAPGNGIVYSCRTSAATDDVVRVHSAEFRYDATR